MWNSAVLDVGIGLILVYLILGLMCTTVHEWVAQCLKMRVRTLEDGIRVLLSGPPAMASRFRPEDINPIALLYRLTVPGDKLASALGLDPAANPGFPALSNVDIAGAGQALADKLNAALDDPGLSRQIDLGRVSADTLAAAQKKLSGEQLRSANHALLREAYPDEIAGVAQAFYNHALIKSLSKPGGHPSYIPVHTFATVLLDILSGGPAGATSTNQLDTIRDSIDALPASDVKRALSTLAQNADNQLPVFRRSLEIWFEDAMDRVSGWYKSKAQIVTVVVASALTIFANADTVQIARKLFLNPAVREKMVQEASAVSQPAGLTPREKADLGELTGWSAEFKAFHQKKAARDGRSQAEIGSAKDDDSFPGLDLLREQSVFWPWLWAIVPGHLLGWFLTAVAASMGAPFWFDTLNKFMNVRSAGTAPEEKGKDLSKV
jgi:hypothetical protein